MQGGGQSQGDCCVDQGRTARGGPPTGSGRSGNFPTGSSLNCGLKDRQETARQTERDRRKAKAKRTAVGKCSFRPVPPQALGSALQTQGHLPGEETGASSGHFLQ